MGDMQNNATYIQILIDTLLKKQKVLDKIILITKDQIELFSNSETEIEQMTQSISHKEIEIKKLNKLDQGFQQVYERVKAELTNKTIFYKAEIKEMQRLITAITEKSVIIESLEKSNQQYAQKYINCQKKKIKDFKLSSRTVSNYYKNINPMQNNNSYFYDKKK